MDIQFDFRDVTRFGQVFTPPAVVSAMLALRQRQGRVLEPSAGDGAFVQALPERDDASRLVALELDPGLCRGVVRAQDFFAYDPQARERFDTIIGNPPYVRFRDILPDTRARLDPSRLDERANLYLFFIDKCLQHLADGGELIFITPRDFLKSTSGVKLNRRMMTLGRITHAIELGDARVFEGAQPNCLIWRFERGASGERMQYDEIGTGDALAERLAQPQWQTRYLMEAGGHLMFAREHHVARLETLFEVRVGGVSGADEIYAAPGIGNRDFVFSQTRATGETRRMLWVAPGDASPPPPVLLPHKSRLIARRVRPFDESNWWHWGRGYPDNDRPRIYVNGRTRRSDPFFLHPCRHFDGSVLGLFPHDPAVDLNALCAALNGVDWAALGFVCDGRFLFTQRSLAHAPLPSVVLDAAGAARAG